MKRFSLLLCLILAAPFGVAKEQQDLISVDAPVGKIVGERVEGASVFRGVPYAQPPVGELRWKPPVDIEKLADPFQAKQFGASCVQPRGVASSIYAGKRQPISEDCLTLNVWVPDNAENAPVFVWIHGGALRSGASSEAMYDGSQLAKTGIIVVSINYRLGILGYLAHPQLSEESPLKVSGNYGLQDQISALRWIEKNISAFGGDVNNVTIAGESAGALSVMYLMAAPQARGLFDKAIMQSAYMITTPELKQTRYGMPAAELTGLHIGAKLKSKGIADLRAMDAIDLTRDAIAAGYAPWGTIDGVYLPKQLVDVFDSGEQAPVPILTGFNSGEIRSLRFLAAPAPKHAIKYKNEIRDRYADMADEFLRLYPADDLEESVIAATRDALYGWTSERLVKKQTEIQQPAYLYYFDHGYPAANRLGLHAFHAAEIPYVFGTQNQTGRNWPKIPDTKQEQSLSAAMLGYWSSFAQNGSPSAEGQPKWASYSADKAYMAFEDKPRAANNLLPGMYEFHEESVCRRKHEGKKPWAWSSGISSPVLPPKMEQCND